LTIVGLTIGDCGCGGNFGHYLDCISDCDIFLGESYQCSVPEGWPDYRGDFGVF